MIPVWPWDRDEEPFFINEKNIYWYKEEGITAACNEDLFSENPSLKAFGFLVAKKTKISFAPIGYVVVGERQNILAEDQSLEGIGRKIDVLRMLKKDEK